jgi:hypothetical protein
MIQFTTANAPLPTIQYNWQQMSTTPTNAVVDFNATASSNGTIYSWAVNNGTTLLNGANVQHTYTQNGSDTVHLQVINGCGSSDTSFVVTIQGIDIKESLLSRSLKLYPNPNDGKFRVSFELEGLKSVELNVSNALGQNVYHKSLGNIAGQRNEDIDLANLPKGMYVLQVNANGQESKIRFVVQ